MLVDVVVFDGVDELDVVGPLEVFRDAERRGCPLTSRLVTRTEAGEVVGSFGLRFRSDAVLEPGCDVLVVPGGNWIARGETGAWAEVRRGELLPPLRAAAGRASVTAGVCTGTLVLAAAGLVGGRPAATHHGAAADLAGYGAAVTDARVVDDGDLVTAGGVTSGIDLALWLVERFFGAHHADAIADRLEYHRARAVTVEAAAAPKDRGART
ncbi:thiamine biosynthesis protein ThiJ [Pseudofrankia sp. EUN1h]|nr:thiamine biosynthesis protein ThiJ [Pseudofrankia sp. EUN1h]